MTDPQELFDELSFYTLAHGDPSFIHKLAVDAYTAQHVSETSRPIALVFAMVGLCLHVEKGFSGRSVQKAHMQLAARRESWPRLPLPTYRGTVTVADVQAVQPGVERDAAIHHWTVSVWGAFASLRPDIAALLRRELDIR